jgi:hypothetical protein
VLLDLLITAGRGGLYLLSQPVQKEKQEDSVFETRLGKVNDLYTEK